MTKNQLRVRTLSQKILYVTELMGQISDGHWENAVPHQHWHDPCHCEVIVDEKQQGMTFYPKKAYGFASHRLVEVVGDRMVNAVKFFTIYPKLLDVINGHDVQCEGDWVAFADHIEKSLNRVGDDSSVKFWRERAQGVMKAMEVSTVAELRAKLLPVAAVDYDKKQMIKDLRELSKLFKEAKSGAIRRLEKAA